MRKFLYATMILLCCSQVGFSAFPTNTYSETINIDQLSESYQDFDFKWNGFEDKLMSFTIENDSGYIDMTGWSVMFKMSGRVSGGSNVCYISRMPSAITVNGSNLFFTISHTNIYPNKSYKAELALLDSVTTNTVRSLGHGTIRQTGSIFNDDDGTFANPAITNIADYLTKIAAAAAYELKGQNTRTDGYVLTVSGGTNIWTIAGVDTDTTYTNKIYGDSTITITGGAQSGVNTAGVASAYVSSWDAAAVNATNASALSIGTIPAGRYLDCSNRWYVSKCGDDANSGKSPYASKLTIQAALDAAEVAQLAGEGNQAVYFDAGTWTEDNTKAKGISLYGAGRAVSKLGGSLTLASDSTSSESGNFSFTATGTTGSKYIVPAGMDDTINLRLRNVGFQFKTLTNFTATPILISSGNNIFDAVGLSAPSIDFAGMGSPNGSFLIVTNGADLSINYGQIILENMNITNGNINIFDFRGTGNIRVKNSSMDITLTNSYAGQFKGINWSAPSGEHQMIDVDIDIEGVDETVGDADGAYVAAGTVRSDHCSINVDGFEDEHSYHRVADTNVSLIVNFSSDTVEYIAEGTDDILTYIGSPQDGLFRTPLFQFGQNGQVYSKFPESPTLTGHNGDMFINFCETKNAVFDDTNIWNNITDIVDNDTEYRLQDSDGLLTGIKLTVTNWAEAKGDGEDKVGTGDAAWVVKIANKSQFETTDNVTGVVHIDGLVVGETNVWKIMASAKDASKDCTNMTFVVGTSTGSVATVDNTTTIVTLTNVATATTADLYCIPETDGDAFLNAIWLTIPDGTGLDERYLKLDGLNAMDADLNVGGNSITNLADPVADQDAVTKAWANSQYALTNAAVVKTLSVGSTSTFGDDITLGAQSGGFNVIGNTNLVVKGSYEGFTVGLAGGTGGGAIKGGAIYAGRGGALETSAGAAILLESGYDFIVAKDLATVAVRVKSDGDFISKNQAGFGGNTNPSNAVDVAGTVKATAFVGDGSGLTGIVAGNPLDGIGRVATNNVNLGAYSLIYSNGPADWCAESFSGGYRYIYYYTNAAPTIRTNLFDLK